MTGRALFNEVFMTDARVADDAVIGDRNNGWAVANSTLMFERAGLSSGSGHAATSAALPGTVAGHLDQRAGDFVSNQRSRGGGAQFRGAGRMLIELAKSQGVVDDPGIRQDLMRLHTIAEIGRFNNLRLKAEKARGGDIAGIGNIGKLSMSEMMRLQRDLGLRIIGPAGMLHAYEPDAKADARRRDRSADERLRHRDGALRAGATDLRRYRSGATQHHRGTGPRPAQGAGPRPQHPVQRTPQERVAPAGDQIASRRRMRSSVGGCVENSFANWPP